MGTVNFDGVRYQYRDSETYAISVDNLQVHAGEFVLAVGASGSGKSTLLRAVNGIVPHLTGGTFTGTVRVGNRTTRDHEPRMLADVVGFVHQDPESQFVVDHVESDIAFVLENLGHDTATMRRRIEEVLDALGIAHLRDREPATLSGGERQRVAIAGALAAAPSILVLDEPTSQLDPQGAEDVLAALARLNTDLGTTVVIAEHRVDRAAPLVDRALVIDHGMVVGDGDPSSVLGAYPGAPTVTQLGRALGWSPLPLTVKAARAFAVGLHPVAPQSIAPSLGDILVRANRLRVQYRGRVALHIDDLIVRAGEIVAILGRNGAGKSTLLRTLAALQRPDSGTVERNGRVSYVPQETGPLFSAPTAIDEIAATLRLLGHASRNAASNDIVRRWLSRLDLEAVAKRHPRSLSGGERQRLAIAVVAVGGAPLLLLDEPTRGMDTQSRNALERALGEHAAQGGGIMLATHDVELAARTATRVVVLGDGEIVADGPARAVLSGSLFAPQTLRVVPPLITVDEASRWAAQQHGHQTEIENGDRARQGMPSDDSLGSVSP